MLPLSKYFIEYAHKEPLIEALYENSMEDIIFCHNRTPEEILQICKNSVNEIFDLCKAHSGTVKDAEEGYLSTSMNGTLNEVCLFKDNDKYDLMLKDWNEWMDYPVSDEVNSDEFCKAVVLTMTFFGFTHELHSKRIKEVNEKLLKIDTRKPTKTYSIEEVDKHIKEKLKEERKS